MKLQNVRVCAVLTVTLAALTLLAADARAACVFGDTRSARVFDRSAPRLGQAAAANFLNHDRDDDSSIVGLWQVTLFLGEGPDIYDQGFEQYHSDGTELMVDNGVPPFLGNVCVGVWKQTGPRTIKLRHTTWNWDEEGRHPVGTFVLIMTLRLDRKGNTFTGKYVADSFDLDGRVIPSLHVEGTARAARITVD